MTKPVVIIGAGLAGLTAALTLHQAGCQVIVLEARSRVGGRVFTLRDFKDGRIAEAGGEFINSEHHRIQALVKEFGLTLEIVPGMDEWFSWLALEGKIGPANDASVWGIRLDEEITKIDLALTELGKKVNDPANPQDNAEAAELDQLPVMAWLESLDVHPLARKGFAARLQAEFLVEPTNHSTLDIARWGSLTEAEGTDGPTYHIQGGNDQLVKAIAARLPDLRLSSPLTAVQQQKGGVIVTYETAGQPHQLKAEQVILALPLGLLQTIHFDPPLNQAYQNALNDLRLGPVTKVLLEYDHPFWHEAGWTGLLLTDLAINCIWLTAGGHVGQGGTLTIYTGGKPAEEYSKMSDEERIASVAAQVEGLFPGSSKYLIDSRTIAWRNEQYTQGGYVYFPPGSVTAYYAKLRQPDGRLYFAGEHTAVFQGYMEGAVESGQRAAAKIISESWT